MSCTDSGCECDAVASPPTARYEALALVSMYVLYCLVMWKNRAIERWILSRYLSAPSAEKRSLMTRDHQPAAAGDSEEGEN